jgi:hypothetical protein
MAFHCAFAAQLFVVSNHLPADLPTPTPKPEQTSSMSQLAAFDRSRQAIGYLEAKSEQRCEGKVTVLDCDRRPL